MNNHERASLIRDQENQPQINADQLWADILLAFGGQAEGRGLSFVLAQFAIEGP